MHIKKISFGNGQLNQFMFTPQSQPSLTTATAPQLPERQVEKDTDAIKKVAYLSSAVAIASIGLSAVSVLRGGGKNSNLSKAAANAGSEIEEEVSKRMNTLLTPLKEQIANLQAKSDLESKFNDRFNGIENWNRQLENTLRDKFNWYDGCFGGISQKIKETGDFATGWLKALEERINGIHVPSSANALDRNIAIVDNLPLLQNLGAGGKRVMLSKKAADEIRDIARTMIYKGTKIPKLEKNSTVYSLTAESIPEKEGGLGEVPVQIAKNLTKELGISNFLVRPLNEIPGVSSIVEKNGKWHYKFKDMEMDVDKVAEYDISVFRNGKSQKEKVEVFYGIDPKFGFKRLMFRNNDFFAAKGLYTDSQVVSEKERYAFFPRAVYEFIKLKLAPESLTSYKVFNEKVFDEIPAPDALLLNDWHAAAMPGLTKLLSTAEAANGELSAAAAKKLKNMNNVELIHNLDYQGDDYAHSADILNTLYGKYAYDIYTTSQTGLDLGNLQNVHVIDGVLNLANISASLANRLKPVSPTYAREIATDSVRSRALNHIMGVRLNEGTMYGESNGWDRSVNELSSMNIINDINNNLNSDKFTILKKGIDSLDLTSEQKASIRSIFYDAKEKREIKFKYNNANELIKSLRALGIDKLNKFLNDMDKEGVTKLRTFTPMTHSDDIEAIMNAKRQNKAEFLRYLQAMNDYNKGHKGFFNLAEEGVTDLSHVDMDNLDDQIVINCGTRFVSQKGINILEGVMRQVLQEWPERYPGKPKPIFPIGGADGEGGQWEALIRKFKADLGQDANTVPYMVGYVPNNVFHGGSDITLYPSFFEPDGSKWESLYKGTPVVATRVGGHVDSIIDGYNGFLSKRTVPEAGLSGYDFVDTMIYDFKEALYRAIDTFFDKNKYKEMVRHSIDGDQSWIIKDKDGKIVGGTLLGHMQDLGFNLDEFPMIANKEAREAFKQARKQPLKPIVEAAASEPVEAPKVKKTGTSKTRSSGSRKKVS